MEAKKASEAKENETLKLELEALKKDMDIAKKMVKQLQQKNKTSESKSDYQCFSSVFIRHSYDLHSLNVMCQILIRQSISVMLTIVVQNESCHS